MKTKTMKNLSNQKLKELRDRFWLRNNHNAKGEILLPKFFGEIYNRIQTKTFN